MGIDKNPFSGGGAVMSSGSGAMLQLPNPLGTITEGARQLHCEAANALTLYARENPSMQRLIEAHQSWESRLRSETQQRLKWTPSTCRKGSPEERLGGIWSSLPKRPQLLAVASPRTKTSMLEEDGSMGTAGIEALLDGVRQNTQLAVNGVRQNTKLAVQHAQSRLQESASQLEGNLSKQIIAMFGSAEAPAVAPLQGTDGLPASEHSSLRSGAIVPWGLRPPKLQHSPCSNNGHEACSSASDSDGSSRKGDWLSPLESLLQGSMKTDSAQPLSLREPGRQVAIVTTAALPWMTGTSINPLLRAAYLSKDAQRKVTLVIPWLSKVDQDLVFPVDVSFDTPEQQEVYVREWVRKRTGMECNFKITWYPGRYGAEKGSILPVGDITQCIPDSEADVAVLEEPEHLTWYHHGTRWTDKFKQVVGVMHTNYLDYVGREELGFIKAAVLKSVNQIACRMHCNKVIKLSDAVQELPRQMTEFVHGVSPAFIQVGAIKSGLVAPSMEASPCASIVMQGQDLGLGRRPLRRWFAGSRTRALEHSSGSQQQGQQGGAEPPSCSPQQQVGGLQQSPGNLQEGGGTVKESSPPSAPRFRKGAYFLSKVLWAKGYQELIELLEEHAERTGERIQMDIYGSGPDLKEVEARASERQLGLKFNGPKDHANADLHDYKVFVNPSLSDVVATTTAEALAMGKFVVCADHPSNRFFQRYPNCLVYKSSEEFSQCLQKALSSEPKPLSPDELHSLSWEAATDRFLDAADITTKMSPLDSVIDTACYKALNHLLGIEKVRQAVGAGSGTRDLPARVTDYKPSKGDTGGFFDNHARAEKAMCRV